MHPLNVSTLADTHFCCFITLRKPNQTSMAQGGLQHAYLSLSSGGWVFSFNAWCMCSEHSATRLPIQIHSTVSKYYSIHYFNKNSLSIYHVHGTLGDPEDTEMINTVSDLERSLFNKETDNTNSWAVE